MAGWAAFFCLPEATQNGTCGNLFPGCLEKPCGTFICARCGHYVEYRYNTKKRRQLHPLRDEIPACKARMGRLRTRNRQEVGVVSYARLGSCVPLFVAVLLAAWLSNVVG